MLGISSSLTGETNAYFSDSNQIAGTIQAGTWETEEDAGCSENGNHGNWDCSSLTFLESANSYGIDGEDIFATIKNDGSTMKSVGKYEIYFIEKGNPKNGKKVSEGELTFDPLKEGQEKRLTFKPTQTGIYMFKAYQHEDHPGKGELWSKEIRFEIKTENPTTTEVQEEVKEKSNEANEEKPETPSDDVKKPNQEQPDKQSENINDESTQDVEATPPVEEKPKAEEQQQNSEQKVAPNSETQSEKSKVEKAQPQVKTETSKPTQVEQPAKAEATEQPKNSETQAGEQE